MSLSPGHAANDPDRIIREETARLAPELVAMRRDLHRHPELAFQETRTAGKVAEALARLGIPVQTGIGRTGVVGLIEGGRPGPTLAIRADMDALPILEKTGLAYASANEGVMHACGHDIHTVTLLGAAEILKGLAPRLAGRIKLIFQPAEEVLTGAPAMIADGVMDNPKVDLALGFHNWPLTPVGAVGFARGAVMASSDAFDVVFKGRSGHAAHPHKAIDAVVGAATFITQAQTVVSREISPLMPAVVSVGMIQGGTVRNILPDTVTIKGTVRTLAAEAREQAEATIRRLLEGLKAGMRLDYELTYTRLVPPMVNDDAVLDRVLASARAIVGADKVMELDGPSMGSEDFACFAELVPSAHIRIGSGAPGRRDMLHNSDFQPDEGAIPVGVQTLVRSALDMLR
ncbi:MAG: amidohydrolase [Alphaproteobacteria bacterium]|nr:amidohydrolase [Alphaproteobacteria bacterium]